VRVNDPATSITGSLTFTGATQAISWDTNGDWFGEGRPSSHPFNTAIVTPALSGSELQRAVDTTTPASR
jgi:hypothetical protein